MTEPDITQATVEQAFDDIAAVFFVLIENAHFLQRLKQEAISGKTPNGELIRDFTTNVLRLSPDGDVLERTTRSLAAYMGFELTETKETVH